jgi:hypothetical protein
MNKGKNQKTSESMKGNQNALKWTTEKCKEVVEQLKALVNEKEEYVVSGNKVKGYKYDFIGELTLELGYGRQTLKREIEVHSPELSTEVDLLYSYMERNCYVNTKKGIIKEATGIVNLKSNHKWTDRQQIDTNLTGNVHIEPKEFIDDSDTQEV